MVFGPIVPGVLDIQIPISLKFGDSSRRRRPDITVSPKRDSRVAIKRRCSACTVVLRCKWVTDHRPAALVRVAVMVMSYVDGWDADVIGVGR
jgi:hypothetical protein